MVFALIGIYSMIQSFIRCIIRTERCSVQKEGQLNFGPVKFTALHEYVNVLHVTMIKHTTISGPNLKYQAQEQSQS